MTATTPEQTRAELLRTIEATREAVTRWNPERLMPFVIRATDSAAMTLGKREGAWRFVLRADPQTFGRIRADELAKEWNAQNPEHAVAVVTTGEYKADRLAECDRLRAFLLQNAEG